MTTMIQLAKNAANALETRTRTNGDKFKAFRKGSPQWMKDLSFAAHDNGSILPDDYRYEFLEDSLRALIEHEDVDSARDSLESSIYTHELTAWLASSNSRTYYVDQAIGDFGENMGIDNHLAMGQLLEMQEVFNLVIGFLQGIADD